jgi:osmotically inducible protein OsmC
MKATGISTWKGSWKQGNGTISTQDGTLQKIAYTYPSRFEGTPGASPEELLAAAHAGCFNQALANAAVHHNMVTESIDTIVDIDLGFDDAGRPEIKSLHFTVKAKVPQASEAQFQEFANMARLGCAISKILKIETTIEATLINN